MLFRLQNQHRHATLAKLLEPMAEVLISLVRKEQSLVGPLIALLKHLVPAVEASSQRTSPVGCHRRTQQALEALHYQDKKFLHTDQLMVNLNNYKHLCIFTCIYYDNI